MNHDMKRITPWFIGVVLGLTLVLSLCGSSSGYNRSLATDWGRCLAFWQNLRFNQVQMHVPTVWTFSSPTS